MDARRSIQGLDYQTRIVGNGRQARSVGAMEVILLDRAEQDIYSYHNKEYCEELVEYRAVSDFEARQAEVAIADFEDWEPDEAGFDAVVAFTAFHWIAPELRYAKPARLLRPGGSLAVVATHHVTPEDADPVWVEAQADYDAVVPHPDNRPPPPPEEVPDLREELEASGLFAGVEVRRHRWDVAYTADEWTAVLGTYSPNIALPAGQRDELFGRIHGRIAARPGGTATQHYLAVLSVGRRP